MEATDPLLGRVIAGKLKLLELLGSGACGKVYRAHHEALDKTVAIKVLHRTEAPGSSLARRFKAEARAASRLDHPNSLRILDFGEDGPDGLLYLAMEFLDGEDLASVLRREGRLELPRAADIMMQVLGALSVAHQLGVVHRDMKPGNIMLLPRATDLGEVRDVVKVCDFGLAKLLDAESEDASGAPLTKQGAILGTPAYMSPEQASGEKTDGLTDLYSCGIILYQMLAGRVPFVAESATGLLMKHIMEEPEPLASRVPGIDPRVAELVHRALAKRKEERFQSAREMLHALREVFKDGAEISLPPLARRSSSIREMPPHAVISSDRPSDPAADTFVRADDPPPPPSTVPSPMATLPPPVAGSRATIVIAVVGSIALFGAGVAATLVISQKEDPPAAVTAQLPVEKPVEKPVEAPKPAVVIEEPKPVVAAVEEPKEKARPKKEKRRAEAPPPVEEEKPMMPVVEEQPMMPVEEEKPPPPPPVEEKPAPVVQQAPKEEPPKDVSAKIGGLDVGGGLSTTRTMGALDRQLPAARKCLETALLPRGVKKNGEIKVSGRIDAYGKLGDVRASGEDGSVGACIASAMQSARLPKPDTGDARISFSIQYRVF